MLPEINFFGISIPTYFIYISFLFSGLLFYVVKRGRKLNFNLNIALNLSLILMLSGLFGSRFFHVIYEQPELYKDNWKLFFYFWLGGFVWYGGFILAFFTGSAYLKLIKEPISKWLDFFAPIVAFGYGLGRVACFLAGCCYGKVCEHPLGVHFPFDFNTARHPTQLYAAVWELFVWGFLVFIEKIDSVFEPQKRKFKNSGMIFCFYACLHAMGRIFMEFFREDNRGSQILVFSIPISISTLISSIILVSCFSFFSKSCYRSFYRS